MTKPKGPLLSLKAHGSIADTLTYQKRATGTIVRRKPIPTDPKTLPQIYQRWDYRDYASLWHSLSAAEKQQWETNARPFRITGFNYWMRTRLNTLPDLAGRWHLDTISNNKTPDSSKNTNHGTVYGALLVPGFIGNCHSFDGTDDYIDCGNDPTLNDLPQFTWEALLLWHINNSRDMWICKSIYKWTTLELDRTIHANFAAPTSAYSKSNEKVSLNQRTHLALTFNNTGDRKIHIFLDGQEVTYSLQTAAVGAMTSDAAQNLRIGAYAEAGFRFDGLIDEAVVYNRILSDTRIAEHSERRYPE